MTATTAPRRAEALPMPRIRSAEVCSAYPHWPGHALESHRAREEHIQVYGYAVPSPAALRTIADHAPILEVGAGVGYWTHLLRYMLGAGKVMASDPTPPPNQRFRAKWTELCRADHRIVQRYPERSVLLIWPDYGATWPAEMLSIYQGDCIIYVGEHAGGCCADAEFFSILERDWSATERVDIPRWYGMRDALYVYRARARP